MGVCAIQTIKVFLIRLLLRVCSVLSLASVQALGGLIGRMAWRFKSVSCRTTQTNLRLCFPGLSQQQRDRLARESLMETAKTACELGRIWELPTPEVMAHIVRVTGEDILDSALASGKGVIIAAPHLGSWELTGVYLSSRSSCTFLYKPPKLARFGESLIRYRSRQGAQLAPTSPKGVAMLVRALGRGELVGILPDQEPGLESGVFAPFFGVQALTMTLIAKLAQRTGAQVVSIFARRLPDAQGFEIVIDRARVGIADPDPVVAATALNATVEDCVRQALNQYQWEYRRFKQQPDQGKNALYRQGGSE
ncbi:MAG: lysophospholipid acyltransferase family protein [Gammaproteobacteria bacterium]